MNVSTFSVNESNEVFYVPNFLTEDEENYLMRKIRESPQQNWKTLVNRRLQLWGGQLTTKNTLISQRLPPFVETYPDIIQRLKTTGVFNSSAHEAPNHIIMNEYLPGQGIMPHQDGPAYHPVVATISLGSHTAFHYYKYTKGTTASSDTAASNFDKARVIDPTPILSVLLEPRSVIITTGSFYTSYLHGIEERVVDVITAGNDLHPPQFTDLGVDIANWKLLTGSKARNVVAEGGSLPRSTRYSLTCRDVERVTSGTNFATWRR